jgi:hypothetical protein
MTIYKGKKIYYKGNIRYILFYINTGIYRDYRINKTGEMNLLKFSSLKEANSFLRSEGVLK